MLRNRLGSVAKGTTKGAKGGKRGSYTKGRSSKVLQMEPLTQKFAKLLEQPGRTMSSRLREGAGLLDHISPKKELDSDTYTTMRRLFLKDSEGEYAYRFIDFLKRGKGRNDAGKFLMPWYLRRGQYEQAAEQFWDSWKLYSDSRDKSIDRYEVLNELNAFNLLEAAVYRNDTETAVKLIDMLAKEGKLMTRNLSSAIGWAVTFENAEECRHALDGLSSGLDMTDGFLAAVSQLMARDGDVTRSLEWARKAESADLRKRLILEAVGMLRTEGEVPIFPWRLLEGLDLKVEELPASLLRFGNRRSPNIPETIKLTLESIESLQDEATQRLALYALLASVDNGAGNVHTIVTILNELRAKKELGLMGQNHLDVIFHTVGKYGMKVTTLEIAHIIEEEAQIALSPENYSQVMRAQCSGTEHETLYIAAIECVERFGRLPEYGRKLIELAGSGERRSQLFLEEGTDLKSVEDLKKIVGYDYIVQHLRDKEERERQKHGILKGMGEYRFDRDMSNLSELRG